MKNFFLIIFLIAFQFEFQAQTVSYVWNLKGTELKEKPLIDSKTVEKFEFASKLEFEVLESDKIEGFLSEQDFFKFKGVWLYVNYKDKNGYIFSGHLSRKTPPVTEDNGVKILDLKAIFGKKIKEISLSDTTSIDSVNYRTETEITEYEHGKYSNVFMDGCFNHTYTFYEISEFEAYNLALSIYWFADAVMEVTITKTEEGWTIKSYDCT